MNNPTSFRRKSISMTATTWVSGILKAAGVPAETCSKLLQLTPEQAYTSLQAVNLQQGPGGDTYGLLSGSVTSVKKRRPFLNGLPLVRVGSDLEEVLKWCKSLSQSRLRPLRSAVTIASLALVEQLLSLNKHANSVTPESKQAFIFCGKVCAHIALVRARDTCAVIRQMVGESICRWALVNPEILNSSVFSRNGDLLACLSNLIIDDETEIRAAVIKGLCAAVTKHVSFKFKFDQEFVEVILTGLNVRCEEIHEGIANASSIEYLVSEVTAHAELVAILVSNQPSLIDSFEQANKNSFDLLYQLTWDKLIPLDARRVIAGVVSSNVLGSDILKPEFSNHSRGLEMVFAFIDQYSPWEDQRDVNHQSVFESFFAGCDPHTLTAYLETAIKQLRDDGTGDKLPQLIEMLAEIVSRNSYTNLKFDGGIHKLLTHLNNAHILNALVIFVESDGIDLRSAWPSDETIVTAITSVVDPRTPHSYRHVYLAYRLWSLLGNHSSYLSEQLVLWGRSLDQHLTVSTLPNIHAIESAVQRPLADLAAMEQLVDFITKGEIPSVSLLACAIDLVVIQGLKPVTDPRDSELVGSLNAKLATALERLAKEAAKDQGEDAQLIEWFCRYRLKVLTDPADTVKKERGHVVFEANEPWQSMTPNNYLISQIIDKEKLDRNLVQFME